MRSTWYSACRQKNDELRPYVFSGHIYVYRDAEEDVDT